MNNANNTRATSEFVRYTDAPELVGRKWQAPDGVAVVTSERTPGGMYIVIRGDGRRQAIRPSIIVEALERSEVM